MIYGTYGNKVVRKATLADKDAIYNILEKVTINTDDNPNFVDMQKRKLAKLIKYHIETKDCFVIVKDDSIVAVYAGYHNTVTYITSIAEDPEVLGILMYTALCEMHNKYVASTFIAELETQKQVFSSISLVDFKGNNGTISVESKKRIEKLFFKIKEYYG